MMEKTAIIDIDNTLWQFCDALYTELKRINDDIPPAEAWTEWDFPERYCSKKQFFNAVSHIHFNQNNPAYLPYPEARAFLSTLKNEGYHITIASHRLPETRSQTEKWIVKHGLKYDVIHLSPDKTSLFNMFTNVVVDDAPHILDKAVENGAMGTGLLFPWNRNHANNGYKLFSNLTDILSHILGNK